jgi:hypothetical protein
MSCLSSPVGVVSRMSQHPVTSPGAGSAWVYVCVYVRVERNRNTPKLTRSVVLKDVDSYNMQLLFYKFVKF